MRKLLVVSRDQSDLQRVLEKCFNTTCIHPDEIHKTDLNCYDAFALLGGTDRIPIELRTPDRLRLDAMIEQGKPFFVEYFRGIAQISCLENTSTRFERPVVIEQMEKRSPVLRGDILDEQCNDRLNVYRALNRSEPIMQYVKTPHGFYSVQDAGTIKADLSHFAMWLDRPNLLFVSFRLCNFAKARFAPRDKWRYMIEEIIRFLGGDAADWVARAFEEGYALAGKQNLPDAVGRAVDWFARNGMLLTYGGAPYAVKEGLSSAVEADGTHPISETIRTDCTGESALMYLLMHLYTKKQEYLNISEGLYRMPCDMQITRECPHYGMVRGSDTGWWSVSYQDDTSRGFLLPLMWRMLLTGDRLDLPRVTAALDYLVKTTGTDGLRATRVDFFDIDSPEVLVTGLHREVHGETLDKIKWAWGGGISGYTTMEELRKIPAGTPSAHYNAFYLAALFLGYGLTGQTEYLHTAEKGMETLLENYPFTAREHSETEELCRLMMPLSMRYFVTQKKEHLEWIHRVADDLQAFRAESGAYLEWDTGYTATCAGVENGESSVLACNGDPVVDFLYSSNWLPVGFICAYFATGDEKFKRLWEEICGYCAKVQITSANPLHDGVWTRAMDDSSQEVYGVPNDTGWAPWSVETGWTMAEIASGMLLGLMETQVKEKFNALRREMEERKRH